MILSCSSHKPFLFSYVLQAYNKSLVKEQDAGGSTQTHFFNLFFLRHRQFHFDFYRIVSGDENYQFYTHLFSCLAAAVFLYGLSSVYRSSLAELFLKFQPWCHMHTPRLVTLTLAYLHLFSTFIIRFSKIYISYNQVLIDLAFMLSILTLDFNNTLFKYFIYKKYLKVVFTIM